MPPQVPRKQMESATFPAPEILSRPVVVMLWSQAPSSMSMRSTLLPQLHQAAPQPASQPQIRRPTQTQLQFLEVSMPTWRSPLNIRPVLLSCEGEDFSEPPRLSNAAQLWPSEILDSSNHSGSEHELFGWKDL
jgi:hypothetical protein